MEARALGVTITIDTERAPLMEVAQTWGDSVLDIARIRASRILVGDDRGCSFFAPREALPDGAFPLVVCERGIASVQVLERFALSIEGEPLESLVASGRAVAVRDGRLLLRRVALRENERARVEIGGVTFLVREVARERAVPADLWRSLDAPFLGVLGLVAMLALTAFTFAPRGAIRERAAGLLASARDVEPTIVFRAKPEETPKRTVTFLDPLRDPEAGAGGRIVGREGRRGKREAKSNAGGRRRGGVIDALDGLRDAFGGTSRVRGADTIEIVGDDSVADRSGHGFGVRDDGPGGGGHFLTNDGQGPAGRGRGRRGDGQMPRIPGHKQDGEIEIGDDGVVMRQRLDPKLVEEAIARHLDAIRACYDRRLYANPDLAGKVVVQFEIAGTGRVASARVAHTTLGDRVAEACVVERVSHIQFPGFSAAGTVSIVYPFLFKTSGN